MGEKILLIILILIIVFFIVRFVRLVFKNDRRHKEYKRIMIEDAPEINVEEFIKSQHHKIKFYETIYINRTVYGTPVQGNSKEISIEKASKDLTYGVVVFNKHDQAIAAAKVVNGECFLGAIGIYSERSNLLKTLIRLNHSDWPFELIRELTKEENEHSNYYN